MRTKRGLMRSSVAWGEIFLIISLSFAVAFLMSEEVGVASAVEGLVGGGATFPSALPDVGSITSGAGLSGGGSTAVVETVTSGTQVPASGNWLSRLFSQRG